MRFLSQLDSYRDEWQSGIVILIAGCFAVMIGPLCIMLLTAIPFMIGEHFFGFNEDVWQNWVIGVGLVVFAPIYINSFVRSAVETLDRGAAKSKRDGV